ncbi:MAG: hypothetical protein AYK18_14570 [Theionarchaea archaeon DG-70]|nr:MAG: hypothetical protein AYK18_14570 [Theionarchaea archaeon DG-70]MBU7026374.1 HEPN domain-containing protein [Theionarchaea archaeon]
MTGKGEFKNERSMEMAKSYLKRAYNKISEAREHLKHFNYSESISASQECIELSIKSVFLVLQEEYPKRHEFKEEEFENILKKIPDNFEYLNFPQLYFYSKFWLSFYTTAKYGLEILGIGADKLFEKEEAELALKHAQKCESAARILKDYIEYPY